MRDSEAVCAWIGDLSAKLKNAAAATPMLSLNRNRDRDGTLTLTYVFKEHSLSALVNAELSDGNTLA
jgi:hypothetical protein